MRLSLEDEDEEDEDEDEEDEEVFQKMKGQLTLWKNHSILYVLVWMREFT